LNNILNILLIEDNSIEIMKMKRTVSFLKLEHTINEAENVDEALEFLKGIEVEFLILFY